MRWRGGEGEEERERRRRGEGEGRRRREDGEGIEIGGDRERQTERGRRNGETDVPSQTECFYPGSLSRVKLNVFTQVICPEPN